MAVKKRHLLLLLLPREKKKDTNDDATDSDTDDEEMANTTNDNTGLNDEDYVIDLNLEGVLPCLRIIYEHSNSQLIRQSFPFRIGPITFQNFGLLPGDINIIQKYHSENYLYPIGFSSVREYWDVEEPSMKCLYVSEIRSGAEEGPTFAVYKALNREICFVSSSSSGAWKALLEQLSIAKVERGEIPTNTLLAVSGPDMYGLSRPEVLFMMQGLPNANLCRKFQFRKVMIYFLTEGMQRYDGKRQRRKESGGSSKGKHVDGRRNRTNNKNIFGIINQVNKLRREIGLVRARVHTEMKLHEMRLHKQRRREIAYEIECNSKLKKGPPKRIRSRENKEIRKKYMEEYTDRYDIETFYLTSRFFQKDTGRYNLIGTDRHRNRYYIVGRNWARLFIDAYSENNEKETYMLTTKEEINAVLNYLRKDGVNEGPLRKTVYRARHLLFRVIEKEMERKKQIKSIVKSKKNKLRANFAIIRQS